jgi:hypothetical protein
MERRDQLDICMIIKFRRQVRVIRHNPSVIYSDRTYTAHGHGKRLTIIGTCIEWISILTCSSRFLEGFAIPFVHLPFFMQGDDGLTLPQGLWTMVLLLSRIVMVVSQDQATAQRCRC